VVARKIPENFDAHFSFLRARKIPRILVAAQSAGAHAHFSNTHGHTVIQTYILTNVQTRLFS
jgi:hypothetical protein